MLSSLRSTWEDARNLRDRYGLGTPVLLDPSGDLAAHLGPVTVPEAFVISEHDRMIYRGRIDDRFEAIGRLRRVIRNRDLLAAFGLARIPQIEPRATEPVGCHFEAWERDTGNATYARDIEPILAANCVECHQEG